MSYVYQQSERGVYTVGYYSPDQPAGYSWISESDHGSREEAARRCNYLNGGRDDEKLLNALRELRDALHALEVRQ